MSRNPAASITASESFAARAQRSEAHRVAIWFIALAGMLLLTGLRRAAHGVVMRDDSVFIPYMTLLLVAMAMQVALWIVLRRANRESRLLPSWVWRASSVADLLVPMALLTLMVFRSPRGPVAALSGPLLLLFPLLIITSILRLRPTFTLLTGLAAAVVHWGLVIRAIAVTNAPAAEHPVLLAYGFVLLLTAIAATFVARAVRAHVSEAAEEAAAHEQSQQAVAIMQRDLSVARDIQAGLLPQRPPRIAGYEIAGMNRPADLTGGDYYDWQELPDGRLAVVIADVTGHGIGPALVMAVCRAYARASATLVREPEQLMERLNDLLHDDLPVDRFVTLVVAILSPEGDVQLLSAGHGPTLLYQPTAEPDADRSVADGRIKQFGGDGLPLGVAAGETYGPCARFRLAPGDALLLVTDGFFEWQRPVDGEQFGIDRLRESMFRNVRNGDGKIDAAARLRAIDGDVRAFTAGAIQPDDMTAVLIRRTASAGGPAVLSPV